METFSALLALCEGNPPVIVDSPHTVTRSFDVFLGSASEQTVKHTIDTPVILDSLWRHCNGRKLMYLEKYFSMHVLLGLIEYGATMFCLLEMSIQMT